MRLFIAMYMNHDPVVEFLQNVKTEFKKLQGRVKFVEPENVHVTLQFLGEVLPEQLTDIEARLGRISLPSFEYSIEGLGFFGNKYGDPRVIWLGIHRGKKEMEELAIQVNEQMHALGFEQDKPFKPHLTIARVKSPVKPKRVFREIIEKYKTKKIYQGKASSFALIQSHLTPQGPVYEVIEEYALA